MKAINIEWDVDFYEDLSSLPTEIDIPKGMVDEDEISDYLSDVTGFCHKGFALHIDYQKEFPYLSECHDFEQVKNHASYEEMRYIDNAIALYMETDKIKADDTGELYHVDGEDVPTTVIAWYCGMIDTNDFISDFFDVKSKPSLDEMIQNVDCAAKNKPLEAQVKVIITTTNDFGEEVELTTHYFDTMEDAEDFVLEHEQDFADDPEIYCVHIDYPKDFEDTKPSLTDQIQSATSRVGKNHSSDKTPVKDFSNAR